MRGREIKRVSALLLFGASWAVMFFAVASDTAQSAGVVSGLTKVAVTGDPAPGASGLDFSSFSAAVINHSGAVSFTATLECCNPRGGAWTNASGNLEAIALLGVPAEATGPNSFTSLRDIELDDYGVTTIRGDMSHVGPDFHGILTGTTLGDLKRIGATGDQIPGLPSGIVYRIVTLTDVNANGRMVGLGAHHNGNQLHDLLWMSDGTAPAQKVLTAGDPATFKGPSVIFANGSATATEAFEDPVINDHRQFAFQAFLFDTSSNTNLAHHIILGEPDGSFRSIAGRGDHAPGAAADARFSTLTFPVINNRGEVAFGGTTFIPNVGASNPGVWVTSPSGEHRAVVIELQDAPGFPGSYFEHLFVDDNDPVGVISDRGDVAFLAALRGGVYDLDFAESVWIGSHDGALNSVIVEGQPAPDMDGVIFHSSTSTLGDMVTKLVMNNHSQLAVNAKIQVNGELRNGIFATDRDGELHKLVAFGDSIEVAPGVFRTVESVDFESPPDDTGSAFNKKGQLVFRSFFSDGTRGVFVSSSVAVPEPSAMILLVMFAATFGIRRRGNC